MERPISRASACPLLTPYPPFQRQKLQRGACRVPTDSARLGDVGNAFPQFAAASPEGGVNRNPRYRDWFCPNWGTGYSRNGYLQRSGTECHGAPQESPRPGRVTACWLVNTFGRSWPGQPALNIGRTIKIGRGFDLYRLPDDWSRGSTGFPGPRTIRTDMNLAILELVEAAAAEDRLILYFSQHEKEMIDAHCSPEVADAFQLQSANAKLLIQRWANTRPVQVPEESTLEDFCRLARIPCPQPPEPAAGRGPLR